MRRIFQGSNSSVNNVNKHPKNNVNIYIKNCVNNDTLFRPKNDILKFDRIRANKTFESVKILKANLSILQNSIEKYFGY